MGINKNLNFYAFIVDYGKKRYQVDPTVHKHSRNAYFAASWKVSGWKTPFRLEFYVNNKEYFKSDQLQLEGPNFNELGATIEYADMFQGIVPVEHHFIYSEITDGLREGSSKSVIPLSYSTLCTISGGGSARIRGIYKEMYPKVKGILIGLTNGTIVIKQTFDYRGSNKEAEFFLSVGEFLTTLSNAGQLCVQELLMPDKTFGWLLVNNIDIKNIEIHTGRSVK
ncbi:uncharacterized protein [Dermacentor andersoni]